MATVTESPARVDVSRGLWSYTNGFAVRRSPRPRPARSAARRSLGSPSSSLRRGLKPQAPQTTQGQPSESEQKAAVPELWDAFFEPLYERDEPMAAVIGCCCHQPG